MMWIKSVTQFFKIIRHNRFFTFLNLFGVGITMMIVMLAAIVLDNVIWPGGPEHNSHRIMNIKHSSLRNSDMWAMGGVNLRLIEEYLVPADHYEHIAFSRMVPWNYFSEHQIENYLMRYCNAGLWQTFDFNLLEGRAFNEQETRDGAPVIVISSRLARRFFPDAQAVGRPLEIMGRSYLVVGVIEDVPGNCMLSKSDVYIPYTVLGIKRSSDLDETGAYEVSFLVQDKEQGVMLKREIDLSMKKISAGLEDETKLVLSGPGGALETFLRGSGAADEYAGNTVSTLSVLSKLLFLMLLPALNMMSIQLTRIQERREEIGVRKAFGATRRQLVRQLLFENTLLTLMGTLLGLVLAIGIAEFFTAYLPGLSFKEGGVVDLVIHPSLFLVALAAAILMSVMSGVIPAYRMARMQAASVLKGGEQ